MIVASKRPLLRRFLGSTALLVAAILASGVGARAETAAPPMTLDQAVRLALGSYPALTSARAREAEARESLGEARADHGPFIFATATGSQFQDPVPVTPIHGFSPGVAPEFDQTLVQGSVQLSYTLFDSGVRAAKVRQANAELTSAGASLSAAEQGIAAEVAANFAQVLSNQQTVEAEAARVTALEAELDRVTQRLAVGKAPEVDRLRAEASVAAAQADATSAGTRLETSQRDLARLLGVDLSRVSPQRLVALAPVASPDPSTRTALQEQALAASPAVSQARAAVAAAQAAHSLARTAYFPKLRTSGAYQELGGSALTFSNEWNVGLQLTVPLWDGGATDRRVARANAALDDARARLGQSELDARRAVDNALAGCTDAAARLTALEKAEQRLVEVARIQNLLLVVGSGTQNDYLAAESDLAATRAALAETRSSQVAARVALARATGELSLDWIARHLEAVR